ncbi:MAG TPA: phosphatidate cytidylyltransferase [Frankiaceae bacterium]|jgi:phosphatidate cytidylyltransferase|nr:phosphatidate cytidylyltransferase [Frankiaceae bacterium]
MSAAYVVAGALAAGGVGVAASGDSTLRRRWLTWAVTAPVVGGLLALGEPGAAALASGLGVVASCEYARLARLARADRALLVAAAALLPVASAMTPRATAVAPWLALLAAVPAIAGADRTNGLRRAALTAFGVLWIAWSLSHLVLLGGTAFAVCAAVSVADVTAWCGGRWIGGPRLSRLSPNKTWGGVAGAALGAALTLRLLGVPSYALLLAVVVGGVLGDLLESMAKREAGVKDAGSWLPGFGGLLDRVDSLLVVLPLAWLVTS